MGYLEVSNSFSPSPYSRFRPRMTWRSPRVYRIRVRCPYMEEAASPSACHTCILTGTSPALPDIPSTDGSKKPVSTAE